MFYGLLSSLLKIQRLSEGEALSRMADHQGQEHHRLQISAASLSLMMITLSVIVVRMVVVRLWWRPRRTERHFSRQGIRGPAYRFFVGNAREIEEMMVKASSQPILPPSSPHNILPRVLPFYHRWKKIYGTTTPFSSSDRPSFPISFSSC